MSFKWDRVHVWSCEITDQPGSVASKLAHLAHAEANLEYIFTKRLPNKPGFGVLYVAPLTGPAQMRAAKAADMHEVDSPVVRRIEGDNTTGFGHHVTQQWAVAGINLQGLTMAVLNDKFVGYAAFDTVHDANRAAQIVADMTLAAAAEEKLNGK